MTTPAREHCGSTSTAASCPVGQRKPPCATWQIWPRPRGVSRTPATWTIGTSCSSAQARPPVELSRKPGCGMRTVRCSWPNSPRPQTRGMCTSGRWWPSACNPSPASPCNHPD
ncbi:hypothetical protein ACFFX0_18710 [Citricoccus parietis]|uniref:Uncharacterized protein n=1 Tax=Citricoccus parietis TaxID=592307 RepID=A0ABV5G2G8_9MICC